MAQAAAAPEPPRARRSSPGTPVATTPGMDATTERLLEAAVRAPSSHNTQPWLFRTHGDTVELFADRTRALPVNDPFDRELTISCGAALFNLRVAAAHQGLAAEVALDPGGHEDLLARVLLRDGPVDEELARLQPAIRARHTTRQAFKDVPLPAGLPKALIAAAGAEGAGLRPLDGTVREQVASLVSDGDRMQFDDPRWRRELASWMHSRRRGDGLAMAAAVAPISRLMVRHFDLGSRVGEADEKLALQAPWVAALTTEQDDTGAWLRAGQALERALLVAASRGVQAGYLNQPCQIEQLRPRLAELAGRFPQIVLRLGEPAEEPRPAPRRAVSDVLAI